MVAAAMMTGMISGKIIIFPWEKFSLDSKAASGYAGRIYWEN